MYATLKRHGMSNHAAAMELLDTKLTFDGRMLQDRIDESSQLSRRVVHTRPGEIPIGLFRNFHISCPKIAKQLAENVSIARYRGDLQAAANSIIEELTGTSAHDMMNALQAYGIDDSIYRNMVAYINHVELPHEESRLSLHLMLFVITGCTGNPRTASILVVEYANDVLGADFNTAETVITATSPSAASQGNVLLGLVRMIGGGIKAGANTNVLNPDGTEIGLLPEARHVVTDVDDDVSRRHAYIWRDGDRWLIRDLGSTNGTRVLPGAGGEVVVGTDEKDAVELFPTDIICLGGTTRFIVMPVLGR